jgi:predicted DNA-binding protein
MAATTLRLPDYKLKILRAISGFENRPISKIMEELIDGYIETHHETMDALKIPGFLEECRDGVKEIESGRGKSIHDLED